MNEHILVSGLALASTLVQFSAAILALRLIPLTRSRLAWSLLSLAFIVQGVRRALGLVLTFRDIPAAQLYYADDVMGLVISLLLLGGVTYISSLFRAIRESEERFRTVADFTYDMEYWRLPNGEFQYLSPSCERISGRSVAAFKSNPDLMLEIVHPDDREMVREHLKQDDQEQTPSGVFEYRILLPDGTVRWLSHACQPVFADDGTYRGRRGSNRDITSRKLAESRQEEVEHILRHDLKSPLMGIIGIPRVLQNEEGVPDHVKRLLGILERSGQDLYNLVESSLAMARLERGEPIRSNLPVNLVEAVRDVYANLAEEARSWDVQLVCTVHGKEVGPQSMLECRGEALLVRSMLANLIKNGLEASSKGDTVSVDLRRGQEVTIVIHNTGLVPEPVRATLFEKYTSAGKNFGTGLGTFSARLIARAHGGDITFTSAPGEGTSFTVHLPLGTPSSETS
ncbi:MAG: PAS domain-containing sensor histidine kinase [Proteobacteria bacterium]|nr:PAS domain-containing sensor histidine kinase [Pseudomonadota bacterium]MBU1610469.1 PAS domain-containing sensor histidine kinase [Pseudomonadota bacterium]